MALSRIRKRKRASLTPLIDVIFLLLLFFMLASTFSRFSEIELVSTAGQRGTAGTDATALTLIVHPQFVSLNGQALADNALIAALTETATSTPRTLAITVTDDTTSQRLTDVLIQLSQIDGVTLRVVTGP